MFRTSLAAGLLAAGLVACSGTDRPPEDPSVLRDDAGREIVLAVPPRRIVSLVPVATEILFELQAGDRLAGRSRWDDYPPEVLAIPDVGDAIRPSTERVLMQEPDLVIIVGGSDNALAAQELERLSVPYVVLLFNTLEDLERAIGLLGRILDREESAQTLWDRIRSELNSVALTVADLERPAVYYDIGYPPAFTAGSGSYLDTLISISGGRNVFQDVALPSPQVSLEAILARDPDLILHPVGTEASMASGSPGDRPGWHALRAVQSGNVRQVPAALVHRLGPRIGAAAREMAAAIHPELAEKAKP